MGSLLQLAAPIAAIASGGTLSPLMMALIAGGSGLAGGLLGGKGPLSSLAQGAIAGGTSYGLNKAFGGGGGRSAEVSPELINSNRISEMANQRLDVPGSLLARGGGLMNPLQPDQFLLNQISRNIIGGY